MITPDQIESKEFKKTALGYSIDEVDNFLNVIIEDFVKLGKENLDLKDKIAMLGTNLEHYRSLENTIQKTLIVAEKTADETKASAYLKGEQIQREAESKAKDLIKEAQNKIQMMEKEIYTLENQYERAKVKLKMLLKSELELLETTVIDFEIKNKSPNEYSQDQEYSNSFLEEKSESNNYKAMMEDELNQENLEE